jgi:hypothetical protein
MSIDMCPIFSPRFEKRKRLITLNLCYYALSFSISAKMIDHVELLIEIKKIPKDSPTLQSSKCCRLGLIEPVHGRYWQVQVTNVICTVYSPIAPT